MGRLRQLRRTKVLDRPHAKVFAFFSDTSNLDALTPPCLPFGTLTPVPIELCGAQLDYHLSLFGVAVRWRTRITDWWPPERFVDKHESCPYALRRHTHEFEAPGVSTLMRDGVDCSEPLGPIGTVAHVLFVRRPLDRIFDLRRDAMVHLLDGTLVKDVEVFRRLYTVIGFGPLWALSGLPGISHRLDTAYQAFSKNRHRLTGRCADGACELCTKPLRLRKNRE